MHLGDPARDSACPPVAPAADDWRAAAGGRLSLGAGAAGLPRRGSGGGDAYAAAADSFPLRVPLPYARRMQRGNARDPLLLQVLPQAANCCGQRLQQRPAGGNKQFLAPGGLVHKYGRRVLWVLTGACAIHVATASGATSHTPMPASTARAQAALAYIAADSSIEEINPERGDPLALGMTRWRLWERTWRRSRLSGVFV